jgi:CheY-like chemotaxis protein
MLQQGSTGLGLPISARLATLLGGRLELFDRIDGLPGTCFRLHLPVGDPGALSPSTSLVRATATPLRRGLRVLIADDSETNRRIALRHMKALERVGVAVSDGDEVAGALAAPGASFDVLLMDINMARVNGDATCAALRAAGCKLPILAMTGNATASDIARYAAIGFSGALGKPFSLEELRHALAGVTSL